MTIRRIYRQPIETARHLQLKKACLDYFTAYDKLMARPSRQYAIQARNALKQMKEAARHRGKELLTLYSDHQNIGREPLYGNHDKFSRGLNRKVNEEEENNNQQQEESYART